ncbi:MAG: tRNA (guanosine(37)-N1)-methyltransferase TrmD [Planctomycetia bacterium]|nr:tRNA (guanosine(37)-N1)-methyltransferase TrmD [Planctomycetia bacterium]
MRFDVCTLFPEMFTHYLGESLFHQAIQKGLISVGIHNMRDWTRDRHKTMDDRPFGGGPGMVLKVEPVVGCVESVQNGCWGENSQIFAGDETREDADFPGRLILLTPQGRVFRQTVAEELAEESRLVFLCGRYEGFDDRVRQILKPDEISIGDYVLNGGEVAAMAIMEAVMRLLPGALGDELSSVTDSFSSGNRLLEAPQFTRPREFRGLSAPEILLQGHHANIEKWREEQSWLLTKERRPDLITPEMEELWENRNKKKRNRRKRDLS